MLDDEQEIELTRDFFREHGLLPDFPPEFEADRAGEERLLSEVLGRQQGHAQSRSGGATWRRTGLIAATIAVLAVFGASTDFIRPTPAAAAGTPAMLRYTLLSEVDASTVASAPSAHDPLIYAAQSVPVDAAQGIGGVQYVSSYGWLSDMRVDAQANTAVIYPTFTQWWLSGSGAVRLDERREPPLALDGRLTASDSEADAMSNTSETNPSGTVPPDVAKELPTDVEPLRAALIASQVGLPCTQSSWWRAECLVVAIQAIYQQYVVPPQLAAAMWRVLADEPELRYLGETTDRLGRAATAIALPPAPGQPVEQTTVLLISTETGSYLGSETITHLDFNAGITHSTVTGFVELLTSRRVLTPGDTS